MTPMPPTRCTRRRPQRLRAAALALAAVLACAPALALDHVWQGGDGDWEDAARWSLLGVPGSNDSAWLTSGSTRLSSTTAVGRLLLGGGRLYGGNLTVGTLDFASGQLGGHNNVFPSGSTTVTGAAVFDGTRTQGVGQNHTLTLQGASTWTAGGWGITGGVFGGRIVNSGSFIDQGADSANGYKALLGNQGSFINEGSYTRTGLGLTRAYEFNNAGQLTIAAGTFEMRSGGSNTGRIDIDAGARLSVYESTATLNGTIANNGLVVFNRSNATLATGLQMGGAVSVVDGSVYNQSSNTLSSLSLTGGQLYGTGHLTTATLNFDKGQLGGSSNVFPTGSTTVTGNATFNGAQTQGVGQNHTLTLQGTSTWTAGRWGITGGVFGGRIVNSGSFIDQGADSDNDYKALLGNQGTFDNAGTYTRSGLGLTRAYGFSNTGLLKIDAGRFAVDGSFSNAGTVRLATGASLEALGNTLANGGLLTGVGFVKTFGTNDALRNNGTLDPGLDAALGTLTVNGGLAMANTGTLRIDLGPAGTADQLLITGQVAWGGELSLWATSGLTLQLGDSYTIASFAGRSGTVFDSISWHGLDASMFTVEYNAQDIVLRVTAVPEPPSLALLLAGALWVARRARVTKQPH